MIAEAPAAAAQLPDQVDIAIVGGGMAGLSLALLLGKSNPSWRILVLEATAAASSTRGGTLAPGFDARSTALSESSREIYQSAGVWASLAVVAEPISAIHVSDRGHPGLTRMTTQQSGVEALGYVVENERLGAILMAAVTALDNVDLMAPVSVECLRPRAEGMGLCVGKQCCVADLVVVADGADSRLLQGSGIETRIRDYGQRALIANIGLEQSHGGVAYERFTDLGPMALLPLPDLAGQHRAALVWTLPPEQSEAVRDLAANAFLEQLQQRFGYRAGRLLRCGRRHLYPLRLMLASEQVRRNLVVVGNAAHFLHPVAGQGFNLALRDLARLAEVLSQGWEEGLRPGNLALLQQYQQLQQADQDRTIFFSDRLPALFASPGLPLAIGRNLGLIALDLVPGLRHQFARFGAGLFNPAAKIHDSAV